MPSERQDLSEEGRRSLSEFDVVFICTGNIFRSAIAEAVFRARTRGAPVHVSSAGTLDLASAPAHRAARALGPSLAIDLSAHRSRCVTAVDLTGADLVVGFERAHVAAAVVEAGAERARTFTLPELVELLGSVGGFSAGDGVECARELVRRAAALRDPTARFPEIVDPIGGPRSVFASTGRLVADQAGRLAETLFPAVAASSAAG